MKSYSFNKSEIVREILAYLIEHPEAEDTIEGITQWWLLEQNIKHQVSLVKEAIAQLVENGLLLELKGTDSQAHYKLNHYRDKDILMHINKNLSTHRAPPKNRHRKLSLRVKRSNLAFCDEIATNPSGSRNDR